ncbi:hypothetical protein MKW92_047900 [Papaver armeniacum]|nr:hypothetical protein MKW92_047900 [Papaver armeniacum]
MGVENGNLEVDAFRTLFPLRYYERHLHESLCPNVRPLGTSRSTSVTLGVVSSVDVSASLIALSQFWAFAGSSRVLEAVFGLPYMLILSILSYEFSLLNKDYVIFIVVIILLNVSESLRVQVE